jgi:hypothetical protein
MDDPVVNALAIALGLQQSVNTHLRQVLTDRRLTQTKQFSEVTHGQLIVEQRIGDSQPRRMRKHSENGSHTLKNGG